MALRTSWSVAGTSGANARGFAPVGSDGLVNAFDIDFVFAQFARNTAAVSGRVVWSNIDQAATFDLSADMTGDLAVDIADVNELLTIQRKGRIMVDAPRISNSQIATRPQRRRAAWLWGSPGQTLGLDIGFEEDVTIPCLRSAPNRRCI